MDLEEFKAKHPVKPKSTFSPSTVIDRTDWPSTPAIPQRQTTVMGPHRPVKNMSNLDAGLCPICQAMVKEVGPKMKLDFRIVYYTCVENSTHRFSRPELDRTEPSQVQKEAWAAL